VTTAAAPAPVHRRRDVVAGAFTACGVVMALVLPSRVLVAGFVFLALGAVLVRARRDAALVVVVLLVAMAVVPASQTISALGSLGAPAVLLGLFAGCVWLVEWLAPREVVRQRYRPVPLLLAGFLGVNIASFAAASLRAKDHLEVSAADRGMIVLIAGTGIALLTSESVATRARLDAVVKAVVVAACTIAAVGVAQFVLAFDLASQLSVPGLRTTVEGATFITERSTFRRVAGTTLHPIEFSVVLCIALPFALHLAMHCSKRWLFAVVLLGLALPMSVSRTAVLGLLALLVVLVPSWPRQQRHRFYLGVAAYLVAVRVAVPGLLGTIRALFVDAGVDPSITSRQGDYEFVNRVIAERPVFGRGFATFIPTRYDFLDNQYLLSLVETGFAGVTGFIVLVLGCAVVAGLVRSRSSNAADRSLAQALVAALLVVAATSAAFDFLSFPTVRMLLFVVVGCVGALWRLAPTTPGAAPPPPAAQLSLAHPSADLPRIEP
jgi:hypothetical protein